MKVNGKPLLFREIGTVIRRRRQQLRLSVQQAADKGGVSRSQWEKVEASTRYPTAHSISSYCRALGAELSELLEEAVSFRDYIAGKIDAGLITYVIVRDGAEEPWEVVPSRSLDKNRAEIEDYKTTMVDWRHMEEADRLLVRPATAQEQEQWRLHVDSQIASGALDPSGEDLDTIRNHPVWISARFETILGVQCNDDDTA